MNGLPSHARQLCPDHAELLYQLHTRRLVYICMYNSVLCPFPSGIAGLQAGISDPSLVRGVQLLDVSLRKLHVKNQPPLARPLIKAFQNLLYTSSFGDWFFSQVAQPSAVEAILKQAYCDSTTVTDELVDIVLKPGLEAGAAPVFLAFICNSDGPLPDEQLEAINVPVSILWGQNDPWEKVEWGREFKKYSAVEEFVELPGAILWQIICVLCCSLMVIAN